ncbi:MAG: serine O-acetyltransferase [Dehalococcoidia bacterium]|nr:serine O-acetyltransferase [Dehalococcoidia bacterium]
MSLLSKIKRDIQVVFERDPASINIIEVVLTTPGLHARELHRLSHTLWNLRVPLLPRLIAHTSRFITGVEIHPGAVIGEGFFIDHGMGVVIGETSVIGNDVSIYQGVTLGGTSQLKVKRHPTLKDDVVVGAGAILIGNIEIGEGVKIGAGSVVISSVPPHATVVGVPGRIVTIRRPDTDTVEHLPDPEWEVMQSLQQRLAELEARLTYLESRAHAEHIAPVGSRAVVSLSRPVEGQPVEEDR